MIFLNPLATGLYGARTHPTYSLNLIVFLMISQHNCHPEPFDALRYKLTLYYAIPFYNVFVSVVVILAVAVVVLVFVVAISYWFDICICTRRCHTTNCVHTLYTPSHLIVPARP